MPNLLSENPNDMRGVDLHDVLSAVLATIRLSGSLQFCFMPTGDWETDAAPAMAKMSGTGVGTMPFHIVVAGACWLKIGEVETTLKTGDVIVFPFGTGHQLGVGRGGPVVTPTRDLPPKPWREIPVLRYGNERDGVRLLCGYLQCEAVNFSPFGRALPEFIRVETAEASGAAWLGATIRQMVDEVDRPRAGSVSMLPRLTEIIFLEVLRHQIASADQQVVGWLAALADPGLARCLSLIHQDPHHDWSLETLAEAAQLSRSALAERFQTVLSISPIKYVRDWRLYLASVSLATSKRAIADIAHDAGYETVAAFNRAFARTYGSPPATWRAAAQE